MATKKEGVANPAPAKKPDSASGAVVEPAITGAIDMDHPAPDFVGQGLDPAPYGSKKK